MTGMGAPGRIPERPAAGRQAPSKRARLGREPAVPVPGPATETDAMTLDHPAAPGLPETRP